MLPKTSTFESLSYCKTPLNIPRFGRKYFSYSQHVGISVTVTQSTFAFKCLSQHLTFVSSSANMSLFAPSPRSEITVELADTRTHWGSFVVSCHQRVQDRKLSAGLAAAQPTSVHVTNQVWVTHQNIVGHLQNLSIQGKNSNSCKKLPRNQNDFSSHQHQKSPAQCGATASICLQSPVLSTHHHLHVPATYLCPQMINGVFLGG